eukprot:sb/3470854/
MSNFELLNVHSKIAFSTFSTFCPNLGYEVTPNIAYRGDTLHDIWNYGRRGGRGIFNAPHGSLYSNQDLYSTSLYRDRDVETEMERQMEKHIQRLRWRWRERCEPIQGTANTLSAHDSNNPNDCVFTLEPLRIHCVLLAYSLCINCVFALHSLCIHSVFTAYSLCIHCVNTIDLRIWRMRVVPITLPCRVLLRTHSL